MTYCSVLIAIVLMTSTSMQLILCAENMSSSTHFWKEKKNPANKVTTNVMCNAHGDKNVMELFLTKYTTLYSSVPTSDAGLQNLNSLMILGFLISDFLI